MSFYIRGNYTPKQRVIRNVVRGVLFYVPCVALLTAPAAISWGAVQRMEAQRKARELKESSRELSPPAIERPSLANKPGAGAPLRADTAAAPQVARVSAAKRPLQAIPAQTPPVAATVDPEAGFAGKLTADVSVDALVEIRDLAKGHGAAKTVIEAQRLAEKRLREEIEGVSADTNDRARFEAYRARAHALKLPAAEYSAYRIIHSLNLDAYNRQVNAHNRMVDEAKEKLLRGADFETLKSEVDASAKALNEAEVRLKESRSELEVLASAVEHRN